MAIFSEIDGTNICSGLNCAELGLGVGRGWEGIGWVGRGVIIRELLLLFLQDVCGVRWS